MALKHHMEDDKIEGQLIFDIDSDCCSEDEDNDWGYKNEDDEERETE
jgi:hypothetical protein